MGRLKTALVLGGGAARGAYEAGVLSYLRDELGPELGQELPLDILVGTSVGAIHACYLAATAHQPRTQAQGMIAHWTGMKVEEVLRFGVGDIFRLIRESLGKPHPNPRDIQYGGLVDPSGLRTIVGRGIPWLDIGRNLRRGHLGALAVSTTHVGSGKPTVFIQQAGGGLPSEGSAVPYQMVATRIGPLHALASAAIPVAFPAVRIRNQLHVDGGLRLNVPLSPALRLGAQRVLVISLRPEKAQVPPVITEAELEQERERAFATAPHLAGKMLNALMMDRADQDLERLRQVNAIVEAGTLAYGPGFAQTLGAALAPVREQPLRYVREMLVRPSRDLGSLAAEYVQSPEFRRGSGLAHRAILRLVEREAPHDADLASYLLFDGGFAQRLIELGRQDARARQVEWLRFWSDAPQSAAEADLMRQPAASAA